MSYITILFAFIFGFYFGSSSQRREDKEKMRSALSTFQKKEKYKIIQKKQPIPFEEETIRTLNKENGNP